MTVQQKAGTPSPAPQPTSGYAGVPTVNFTVPTGSGGAGYGLTSDAGGASFDIAGLTGLGTGVVKGSDLLKAFIAAGSGRGDPAIVAAIQQALYLAGGFYTGSFVPTPGALRADDIKAFAAALNQLSATNSASPQGAGMPTVTVAQFLTRAAQTGLEGGQSAGVSKAQKAAAATYTIRKLDPAAVAAEYQKVAQGLEGKKPSEQETQDFVSQYLSKYQQTQKSNAAAAYAAATGQPADPTKMPLAAPQPANLPHGITATDPNTGVSPESGSAQPADFPDSMQTLQQILATNAVPGEPSSLPGVEQQGALTGIDQKDAPDLDTAAANFARNTNPSATKQTDLGNTMDMFLNLITQKMV